MYMSMNPTIKICSDDYYEVSNTILGILEKGSKETFSNHKSMLEWYLGINEDSVKKEISNPQSFLGESENILNYFNKLLKEVGKAHPESEVELTMNSVDEYGEIIEKYYLKQGEITSTLLKNTSEMNSLKSGIYYESDFFSSLLRMFEDFTEANMKKAEEIVEDKLKKWNADASVIEKFEDYRKNPGPEELKDFFFGIRDVFDAKAFFLLCNKVAVENGTKVPLPSVANYYFRCFAKLENGPEDSVWDEPVSDE